jgi:streptogramin lyase
MDIGPHSLHRGADGSLWMAPFVSSVVAHLDVEKEKWRTWGMKDVNGRNTAIHDLSFGSDHTLLKGKDGNIWFSDVVNNSVGYLNPDSGKIELFRVPEEPGRPGNQAALYGLVMESNREKIWYTQLGTGSFGRFNILSHKFEQAVHLPKNSGPRRLTITDKDVLYVPLYGSGQLIEYDTKTDKQLGIYDLPDTASAPYAVTWDPVRDVVWIPTSNGDVIYRFDCKDKSITALPMPRKGALLRMIDVDPDTGWLITSYANIVEQVQGPRMALIIDPGDEAYNK